MILGTILKLDLTIFLVPEPIANLHSRAVESMRMAPGAIGARLLAILDDFV